jgi:hypothetical protein
MHKLEELLDLTLSTCESWVKPDSSGALQLEDPIDGNEISHHYGASHAAAAFIILGDLRDDILLFNKGKALLRGVIKRWDVSEKRSDFHSDFNNFALCIVYDYLLIDDLELCEEIKKKVLITTDSNHNTVNWLPMRWYVNLRRHEWTGQKKYQNICQQLKLKIAQATNKDGGIEDILPKGTSFNLQYDIATVAALQLLRVRGVDLDISKELSFLMNCIAPDGDINYQGRGTNQIFAWGMWIYLLSSSNNELELEKGIDFLMEKIPSMLENNNIMLNSWCGQEKYLWWDYHYCSVYSAHFLFWLVLSKIDNKKKPVNKLETVLSDSGVSVIKTSDFSIITFNGRKKYLAESGPIISAFWIKKYGIINKGTFGPWQGAFGNKYSFGDVIFRNYFGLLKLENNFDWSKNKIINKLLPNFKNKKYISAQPIMANIGVKQESNIVIITFDNSKLESVVLNFPIFNNKLEKSMISLLVDGEPMEISNNLKIRNQYGWCKIYQSKKSNARKWILKIRY